MLTELGRVARTAFIGEDPEHGDLQGPHDDRWNNVASTFLSLTPGGSVRAVRARLLFERAHGLYSNPCLRYHNWSHIQDVLAAYTALWGDPHPEVLLAIGYHDCVYVPGAEPGVNERLSAQVFRNVHVHEFGPPADIEEHQEHGDSIDVEFVVELVNATVVANHVSPTYAPKSVYEARLLDCDLNGLGKPWPQFCAIQDAVLYEMLGPSGFAPSVIEGHRCHQAEFLARFLQAPRPHVYHTAEARDRWEDQVQSNIGRFLDAYL